MTPLDYAAQIAYSTRETLYFSYEIAKKYNEKNAVFVECGVAAGAQIIAMRYGAPDVLIFAYDSFEGIPLPSNRDDQMPGIQMLKEWEQKSLPDPGKQKLSSTGATSVPVDDFWAHLVQSGVNVTGVIPVRGWFEETVPNYMSGPIQVLRLDGDLYNSTFVCLQYLFPHVVKGGCVIIDDWQLPGCQAAVKEYFDLIGYEPNYQYVSNICYLIK